MLAEQFLSGNTLKEALEIFLLDVYRVTFPWACMSFPSCDLEKCRRLCLSMAAAVILKIPDTSVCWLYNYSHNSLISTFYILL